MFVLPQRLLTIFFHRGLELFQLGEQKIFVQLDFSGYAVKHNVKVLRQVLVWFTSEQVQKVKLAIRFVY
jgi:hypothetical protein